MPGEKVSLKSYWDMLNAHDWYYDYSDDHSVWKAGLANKQRLRALADDSVDHKEMCTGFEKHYFSGEVFGTLKLPKPPKPS